MNQAAITVGGFLTMFFSVLSWKFLEVHPTLAGWMFLIGFVIVVVQMSKK